MKCEVCEQETRINYGNSSHIVCEKCYGSERTKEIIMENPADSNDNKYGNDRNSYHPFTVGVFVAVIGFIAAVVLSDLTRVNIFAWSIFIFFGIFSTSVAFIIKELKNIQKHLEKKGM